LQKEGSTLIKQQLGPYLWRMDL